MGDLPKDLVTVNSEDRMQTWMLFPYHNAIV